MKTYDVTVKCSIVQTIRVEAENEQAACEAANELFAAGEPTDNEYYEQDCQSCMEVVE